MRHEYNERDLDASHTRDLDAEAHAQAVERFCPPQRECRSVRPDELYWHELLTATAALLEEIGGREGGDEAAKKLADLYREQAAGMSSHCKCAPISFVRGE